MAVDPNSMVGQSQTIYDTLSTFFRSTSDTIVSGGTFPVISDVATGLQFTELLRLATQASSSTPSFRTGSAVETIHLASAILREYGLRVKSKSEYYSDGVSDHKNESDYYNSQKFSQNNMLSGHGINGSLTT